MFVNVKFKFRTIVKLCVGSKVKTFVKDEVSVRCQGFTTMPNEIHLYEIREHECAIMVIPTDMVDEMTIVRNKHE